MSDIESDHESENDSGSDSDGSSDISVTEKKVLTEVFQEDSVALNLAAEEESHLRREADARIKDLGVTDPMLLEASNLFEKVKIEKLNDHGKPWKAPPPVTFSTEYWREWQKKVKVDKASYDPAEKERRHRLAEREHRKNRPKVRAPLPKKVSRHGVQARRSIDFAPQEYFVTSKNNPRKLEDKKKDEKKELKEVERMMRLWGKERGEEYSEEESEEEENDDEANGDDDDKDHNKSIQQLKMEITAERRKREELERKEKEKKKAPKKIKVPDRTPAFSTGTRQDWAKINSVDLKPTVQSSHSTPATHYDVELAEKSMTLKRVSNVHIVGRVDKSYEARTRETPGPIYNAKLGATSTKPAGRSIEFTRGPRFKVKKEELGGGDPGPGKYTVGGKLELKNTLPFDGLVEFNKSAHETKAPDLRAMRNFGAGCSYEEHVLYGQCLDGKCSQRSPWEKFNTKKIKYWRKKGARIKGEEKKGNEKTAVHFAVIYTDLKLVDKLLMDGIDVDAVDEDGKTALHLACEKGLTRITERILNNADHPQILKIGFVSKRINPLIDVCDKNGQTPLHLAAIGSHRKCCELLIDAGSDPDILNKKKQTALDVSGTQALFQQLEYYSEMSKERARTSSLVMRKSRQERRVVEWKREKERKEWKKASAKNRMMTMEMEGLNEKGRTMLKMEEKAKEAM
ncbi:hypothetical protein TrLO_g4934 [Triparma laevis f. longispina]|uniref:Uncharacterized protein n=1 Tax=Triparma laevis f. longispina TaxID=1714387 RepID=A0A9W7F5E3_9STRA|nr:hypothetical protein TrLO_g4934 [Triparma laevis f. longispina]